MSTVNLSGAMSGAVLGATPGAVTGAINLSGLSSGIDTNSIIQQLMTAESAQLNSMQSQMTGDQTVQTNLGTLQSDLNAFQTAVQALDNSQTLRSYSVSSSDTTLATATASYNAVEGNHTVVINQLASAERLVQAGVENAEDLVGAGTFIYSYDHKETTITTTATTTLNDLVNLINDDPNNPGVTASILQYDDGNGGVYHLVLSGNDSGSDYNISINNSNTNVLSADSEYTVKGANATGTTKITDLDQFQGILGSTDKITIAGTNQNGTAITPVNLTVTHDTTISRLLDEINTAYGGAATATLVNGKIQLTDNTDGASQTSLNLTFTPDPSGAAQLTMPNFTTTTQGGTVAASLAGFESSTFTQTQAAADAKLKVDGYPQDTTDANGNTVENWITRSSNTLSDIIPGVTLNLQAPGTVQLNLTRQTDSFKNLLNTMISAYNNVVTYIQQQTAYDATTNTAGPLMGDGIVTDIQSQMELPFMSQVSGFTNGVDSFVMPGQIGLAVDSTGKLTLDDNALTDALNQDYNGVLDLVGATKTGSSSSNAIQFYNATSNTTAGAYNVKVTFNNGVITAAQIKSSSESTWRDATVSGNSIIGNNQLDSSGQPIYPENGLSLTATYSGTGTITATVEVKEGFAGQLNDSLTNVLNSQSGELQLDQNAIGDSISQLQNRIDTEQARLTQYQTNLQTKFANMEAALAQLQEQQAAVSKM